MGNSCAAAPHPATETHGGSSMRMSLEQQQVEAHITRTLRGAGSLIQTEENPGGGSGTSGIPGAPPNKASWRNSNSKKEQSPQTIANTAIYHSQTGDRVMTEPKGALRNSGFQPSARSSGGGGAGEDWKPKKMGKVLCCLFRQPRVYSRDH